MEKGMLRLYCLATRYCQTRSKHTLTLTRFISQQDVQKYADLTGKWDLLNYKDFFYIFIAWHDGIFDNRNL